MTVSWLKETKTDSREDKQTVVLPPSATLWLIDVFSIVFGQQLISVAWRNKIYLALDAHTILVSGRHYSLTVTLRIPANQRSSSLAEELLM